MEALQISIHAPRVGSDSCLFARPPKTGQFQSTLPVWGATATEVHHIKHADISIHAPRVGSDLPSGAYLRLTATVFQSTLPVWGATRLGHCLAGIQPDQFQSTLPVWGATVYLDRYGHRHWISIHAPRVGSDHNRQSGLLHTNYFNPRSPCGERLRYFFERTTKYADFNPRSPCGERHIQVYGAEGQDVFQSTLPVWGATSSKAAAQKKMLISIHAPRVGSD